MDRGGNNPDEKSSVLYLPAFVQAGGGSDPAQASNVVGKCAARTQSAENPSINTDGRIYDDFAPACHGAAPTFDQRPGEFEATRGLTALSTSARLSTAGRHEAQGWMVLVFSDGHPIASLTPDQARALADELRGMANICQYGWDE